MVAASNAQVGERSQAYRLSSPARVDAAIRAAREARERGILAETGDVAQYIVRRRSAAGQVYYWLGDRADGCDWSTAQGDATRYRFYTIALGVSVEVDGEVVRVTNSGVRMTARED